MKPFTIHVRRFGIDPETDVQAVREGFNFWAFLFTFIWSLFKGYWIVSAGLFGISLIIAAILMVLEVDPIGQFIVNISVQILIGLYANDMARWTLARRGYMEEEILKADSANSAVEKYVETEFV